MKIKGEQIKRYRELKGLTQKELAKLTNLNTRTIQRLENEETEARLFTLNRIAEVLELPINSFHKEKSYKFLWPIAINIVGLILLNLAIAFVFGYLTLDSGANFNSLIGAILLSIFMPFAIYFFTKSMSKEERLLKYSSGLWVYLLIFLLLHGPVIVMSKGLLYVIVLFSTTIYLIGKLDKFNTKS
jgi:transcriptional regulator with XRE-family HTH domain